LEEGAPIRIFAKLESANPGGSVKDRPALHILDQALESGALRPGGTVIESSSGNMAIGLAQVCLYRGLRLICVVDPKATRQNLRILQAYGAEIEMVEQPDPRTGEFLQARLNRVKQLVESIPNAYWPDQYSNTANSDAHHSTMAEIVNALESRVDFLYCCTSTFGTLRGCAEYVRMNRLNTRICAVDAIGSVIFGGVRRKRLIPGHGAAVRPNLFQGSLADRCILVSDLECVRGCRRLLNREAILAGGSSGAVLAGFERVKEDLPPHSTCVLILPDRGDRYLDTIYSDEWVIENIGYAALDHECELQAKAATAVETT